MASEMVSVHGSEVVEGAKTALNFFARKKAEGAAKRAATTPGTGGKKGNKRSRRTTK